MKRLTTVAALAISLTMPIAAHAGTVSGTFQGQTWTAENKIIGQTSTATGAGGGNPIYFANDPKYSGVVALIMDEGAAGLFICSGSLLPDRQSILTAGHCVSGGAGTANPIATTAYFYGGPDPDLFVPFSAAATAVSVSQYFVNPNYTGEVIDQNDIAVLRLAQKAPDWAASYNIAFGGDLTGKQYNVAGFGARSDVGGAVGADLGTGRRRQGDNTYAFRLGDPDFGGAWPSILQGPGETAAIDYSYLADFDNGNPVNDAACALAGAFGLGGSKYCNTGLGATEVSTAGGDSGGPQFINGRIASVTGYGITFGTGYGDIDNSLNDTFGELNGFIPTFIHADFIHDSMVPEPATWAMLLVGFGMMGYVIRRRAVKFGRAA